MTEHSTIISEIFAGSVEFVQTYTIIRRRKRELHGKTGEMSWNAETHAHP